MTRTKLEIALELAAEGFHVFPLEPDSKLPAISAWNKKATRDEEQIRKWFTCPVMGMPVDRNIGISTTHFGYDMALIVVDIDNKNGKNGTEAVRKWEEENGITLRTSFIVETPTGGYHWYFTANDPVKNGVNVLGPGVDIRSLNGFVVAPGSTTNEGIYTWLLRKN